MKKNIKHKLISMLLAAAVGCAVVPAAFPEVGIIAYAEDYRIGSADWEYDESGKVQAVWDEANDKTSYQLSIYRGSIKESNKVYKNKIKVSYAHHDFGLTIAKHGTGTYYYTVYPTKGGAGMMITSGALEVDSDMLSAIRKYYNYNANNGKRTYTSINYDTPLGWTMLPDGTWKYHLTKTSFAKNQWLKVNGKWYYFGADSIMLTGWQNIGGRYFYFNKDGDLWMGGNQSSTAASGSATANAQTIPTSVTTTERTVTTDNDNHAYTGKTQSLNSISITFKEEDVEPGKVRPMTINVPSSVELVSQSYSVQPENWSPGTKVSIVLTVKTTANYQFGNGMKVGCSNGTFKSQSGDAFTRTLKFEYVAKTRLAKPQRIYLDGESLIKWQGVSNASRYSVKISYDEEYTYSSESSNSDMTIYTEDDDEETRYNGRNKSFTVSSTQFDASQYIDVDEIKDVKFYITAMASSSRSAYYLSSEAAEFTAEQGSVESSTNIGSVTTNKSGDMVYIDGSGDYITGWQDINGAWYYFQNKGNAVTGWKQIDKRWYYFGEDNKMVTGWAELGGYWYYLNEGGDDTYGAMLTGTHVINGVSYYLNDSTTNGVPLGAWIQQ